MQGQTQDFTALAVDQFGNAMANQPTFTWSAVRTGTMSSGGLYTAPSVNVYDDCSLYVYASAGSITGYAYIAVKVDHPVIDFHDNTLWGNAVTDQYETKGIVFSYDSGYCYVAGYDSSGGSLSPITYPNGNLYVDFNIPVNNLVINTSGYDDPVDTLVMQAYVFVDGAYAGTVDIQSPGENWYYPYYIDLSSYQNVTRVEFVNITDYDGLVFRSFAYDKTTLLALTVADSSNTTNYKTEVDTGTPYLNVKVNQNTGLAYIDISATFEPGDAGEDIAWSFTGAGFNIKGTFENTQGTKKLVMAPTALYHDYVIKAWVDGNHNKIVDSWENWIEINVCTDWKPTVTTYTNPTCDWAYTNTGAITPSKVISQRGALPTPKIIPSGMNKHPRTLQHKTDYVKDMPDDYLVGSKRAGSCVIAIVSIPNTTTGKYDVVVSHFQAQDDPDDLWELIGYLPKDSHVALAGAIQGDGSHDWGYGAPSKELSAVLKSLNNDYTNVIFDGYFYGQGLWVDNSLNYYADVDDLNKM
jgi:hypothetical protein